MGCFRMQVDPMCAIRARLERLDRMASMLGNVASVGEEYTVFVNYFRP
jgi:hypothetical protein